MAPSRSVRESSESADNKRNKSLRTEGSQRRFPENGMLAEKALIHASESPNYERRNNWNEDACVAARIKPSDPKFSVFRKGR